MNRVMGVRNDEELKNLRKIGIVGVRCRKTTPATTLTNAYTFTVDVPLALGRNSM